MAKHPKRPRDPMQLAKLVIDMATGEVPNDSPKGPENAATAAKRKGGITGGTSAMEAGKADHVWSLEEIADLAK